MSKPTLQTAILQIDSQLADHGDTALAAGAVGYYHGYKLTHEDIRVLAEVLGRVRAAQWHLGNAWLLGSNHKRPSFEELNTWRDALPVVREVST